MATRVQVHRPLKVVAFNTNGFGKQHFKLSKQLLGLPYRCGTSLQRFFIPNYQIYQTDPFPGLKGRTAIAVLPGRNKESHKKHISK
jgi:hypothetical protein